MGDDQAVPAYVARVMSRLETDRPALEGLFMHLGYWPEPVAGAISETEFAVAQRRLNDVLVGLAGMEDGLSVLDLGCGFGGTLASLMERWHRLALCGVNIDAQQLSVARRSVQPRPGSSVEWLEADACQLPLPSDSFDRVLAVECVFHFASRARFFCEAARVLRRGGRLVLSDFVVTPRGQALGAGHQGRALAQLLAAGIGPWPDPWHEAGDPVTCAASAGLRRVVHQEATANVQPTFRHIAPAVLADSPFAPESFDRVDRATMLLDWLLREGHLRMEFFAFEKPEA